MTSRRVLFLGPPGAGKGTQASKLAGELEVPHVSTGDMLRGEVVAGSELGRAAEDYMDSGELVPDDLVITMLARRIERQDARRGFILDGFPRNLSQAQALGQRLGEDALDVVVLLEVPEEEIVRRISGRRSCAEGHIYHVEDDPPEQPGVCGHDGQPLFQREDDREEVVRNRLRVYREQTEPLVGLYDERGSLHRVEGRGDPESVARRVLEAVR